MNGFKADLEKAVRIGLLKNTITMTDFFSCFLKFRIVPNFCGGEIHVAQEVKGLYPITLLEFKPSGLNAPSALRHRALAQAAGQSCPPSF